MKRYLLFLIAIFFSLLTCFAQLDKFEGTWIHKDTQMYIDMQSNEHPDADRRSFFRFEVSGNDILIRHKTHYIFFETGHESTSYFTIKNIVINADSTISCDIYSPPEIGKTYSGKKTPQNRCYDKLVEHSNNKLKTTNSVLIVESGPTIREFYFNGQLVETDCYPDKDYVYRSEYYNEKDNW